MEASTLSLVLPCFNEEANVERTVRDVLGWYDRSGTQGEVVAVDDGSRDGTRSLLQKLAATDPRLRVVWHEVNQGYGAAIRTGCDSARMEILGFMDSDGQFHAEDLRLLLPYIKDFAFVTGRRRRRADSFTRNMLGKVLGLMNWIVLGLWVRDVNCGMKIFRKDLWPKIRPVHGIEKLFNTELFMHLRENGIAWKTIDVPHYPRTAGNPTGAKWYVIRRMLTELRGLRKVRKPYK